VKLASDKFDLVEIGHKVWLAGLGAMARAQSEGPKLFEALVEEGAIVQERARETTEQFFSKAVAEVRGAADERMEALRGTANETWDNVEKIFQSRVQKALQQIGMPTSHEIRALTRKVDDLTRSVEGLSAKPRRAGAGRTTSSEAASSAAV
jgi:poly(hydroxyalkanoate) granule-associated protein